MHIDMNIDMDWDMDRVRVPVHDRVSVHVLGDAVEVTI
jgi:hypothetical protein